MSRVLSGIDGWRRCIDAEVAADGDEWWGAGRGEKDGDGNVKPWSWVGSRRW